MLSSCLPFILACAVHRLCQFEVPPSFHLGEFDQGIVLYLLEFLEMLDSVCSFEACPLELFRERVDVVNHQMCSVAGVLSIKRNSDI